MHSNQQTKGISHRKINIWLPIVFVPNFWVYTDFFVCAAFRAHITPAWCISSYFYLACMSFDWIVSSTCCKTRQRTDFVTVKRCNTSTKMLCSCSKCRWIFHCQMRYLERTWFVFPSSKMSVSNKHLGFSSTNTLWIHTSLKWKRRRWKDFGRMVINWHFIQWNYSLMLHYDHLWKIQPNNPCFEFTWRLDNCSITNALELWMSSDLFGSKFIHWSWTTQNWGIRMLDSLENERNKNSCQRRKKKWNWFLRDENTFHLHTARIPSTLPNFV